jgi:hypothetical protein
MTFLEEFITAGLARALRINHHYERPCRVAPTDILQIQRLPNKKQTGSDFSEPVYVFQRMF